MNQLPVIDLGLMTEHLTAHKGALHKLQDYNNLATDQILKDILVMQSSVLYNHVLVMLALINPYQTQLVELPPLPSEADVISQKLHAMSPTALNETNQWIAMESHTSAKNMSNTNYLSALMMKNDNVRHIHVQMALQQLTIQDNYEEYMRQMGWSFFPVASFEEQLKSYNYFLQLF
ncbi:MULTISPECIES: hypothetical protein [Virgibacillus]|uniref:Spore coat protein n=1 Tax=Virgibacillus kapii TaxID=1638645 RepID=A0ABQ2DX25_9BACI|nr:MULTISPECIES: hypothetical protein [Virgibacillus]EQB36720.1 hypothetical protein M948_16945 [Virgibacillus sp. CM-4]MYL42546.1 hypothetical protein [Virgibacillus massiliensis]GGJ74299.1 hypothetical protein GCM10007111_39800 [Virgibacillus kapii]